MDEPDNPAQKEMSKTFWIGALAANATIGGLYLALAGLMFLRESALVAIPSTFLIPIVGGLIAARLGRHLAPTIWQTICYSFWTVLIGCLGAPLFFGEGAVCLVIAFPILYLAVMTGALVGRVWFRTDRSQLRLAILPLVALLTIAEVFNRVDEQAVVVDELLIHAPPSKVWPHLLAFSDIKEPPSYWIFRLGLPHPIATTNGGNYVGADRQCIFSDGIVIKEKIVEFVPNERLTFDIVEQPTHPEAYGHITLHRGQFDLRDNGDGTTTLIGSSWYTLHVRPLSYFDWWTRDMTREVHLRVMNHVRRLAEG